MKMRKGIKNGSIGLSLMLAVTLVVNAVSPLEALAINDGRAEEKVSVKFTSELSGDKSSAQVTAQAFTGFDTVKVIGITLPNGQYISGSEAVYTAARNGRQDFIVEYEEIVQELQDGGHDEWPGGNENGGSPVSYTHLDVYKRQT